MSGRKLDIGIASYGNPEMLERTIQSVLKTATTDFRLFIVDNPTSDGAVNDRVKRICLTYGEQNERITYVPLPENKGYAGAVNKILQVTDSEYVAYCDNDIEIRTKGWDEKLAKLLDRFHEIGMAFSGTYGTFPIDRGAYREILWGVGCFWMTSRLVLKNVGLFDENLGHQEEVDFQIRLRLGGWISAQDKEVQIVHRAKATSSPDQQARIAEGVKAWVEKWEKYFGGQKQGYHSTNVLRFELWPTTALYMEEIFKQALPGLNDDPEVVQIAGRNYDLIKVPRLQNYYRGRII